MKITTFLLILGVTLVFAINFVTAASMDNIYVNDSSGSDLNNGTSWEYAKKSISNATGAVNVNGTIYIAKGHYSGVNNTNILIDKDMAIIGENREKTVISGDGSAQIFYISFFNVTFYNLTFINGKSSDSRGGAIFNNGNIFIEKCNFTSNTAYLSGGAIFNNGSCIVKDSIFANNHAITDCGSAIFNNGTCTVNDSIFSNNNSTLSGGAITNHFANCTVLGSIFTDNQASYGGAIYNYYGDFTLSTSIFKNNKAEIDGGAFGNRWGDSTVTGCNFENNTATNGGALSNYHGASVVHYNRIIGNYAPNGNEIFSFNGTMDAIYNWWGSNEGPVIENIVGDISYNPWLVLSIDTNPATINEGERSSISADVYIDSAGSNHSKNWTQFFSGVPVKFTTNMGQIGSKEISVLMSFGKAIATLNANEGAGFYILTATLDNQIVQAGINVNQCQDVNAVKRTIKMKETGLPLNYVLFAILLLIGGILAPKRK